MSIEETENKFQAASWSSDSLNTRLCIFCGKQPEKKNNEHVIPLWLISMTGDQKRDWTLGYKLENIGSGEIIKFSADKFKFPSCEVCNSEFSNLESTIKK